ncbi:P-II family nitrogen regulator [Gimesia sp.]|uniref:P-II family nitrogen regulator n=1 Tax=Gimesia sp. TaxID=2024833 RepID=UPI003A94C0DF
MKTTIELTKVIVITETHFEQEMLNHFRELGIKGFTCMNCWGQGHHQVYDEPFIGHSQTRIEIITTEEIADSIVDYCRQPRFETHAVTAYLETVRVREPAKFIA